MSDDRVMFTLDESEQVTHWYNIVADLPTPPPPPLHPGTREPVGPDDLAPLFPIELIMQEVTGERYVEIPGPVLDVYKQYRPSPLFRARRWEQKLGTPARIYYKYEGVSPAGSHKTNTVGPAGLLQLPARHHPADDRDRRRAVGHRPVVRRSALRGRVRGVAGRRVVRHEAAAPHPDRGLRWHRAPLAEPPDRVRQGVPRGPPGLAGIAISEAVEVAAQDENSKYALGSVLNHVLMHQTVIGEEALRQLAKAGEPSVDLVVGCAGGGSNFAGLAFPFLREKLAGNQDPRILAVEPSSCPTPDPRRVPLRLRRHRRADPADEDVHARPRLRARRRSTPAGCGTTAWRRWCRTSSHEGLIEATALHQNECFEAGLEFARTQGIVAAPESSHALAQVRREALAATEPARRR